MASAVPAPTTTTTTTTMAASDPHQATQVQPVSGKIFYATHYTKTTGIRWPTPRGGPLSFYTTWNMILGIAVTCITLVTIPWLRIWPITQKIAAFTVVPLAIAAIASIFCTAIVSQMLMSFNIKVERPTDEPHEDKDKSLCISIPFTQNMLAYNFIFHLGPLIFAILLSLAITFIPAPSTLLGRSSVFLMSLLFLTIFCVAWLVTPTKIGISQLDSYDNEEGEDEKDEPCTGFQKINRIYRNPPSWYMSVIFPGVAIMTMVFCAYVLYGASMSLGFKGF
jgi:hypothetical protein